MTSMTLRNITQFVNFPTIGEQLYMKFYEGYDDLAAAFHRLTPAPDQHLYNADGDVDVENPDYDQQFSNYKDAVGTWNAFYGKLVENSISKNLQPCLYKVVNLQIQTDSRGLVISAVIPENSLEATISLAGLYNNATHEIVAWCSFLKKDINLDRFTLEMSFVSV